MITKSGIVARPLEQVLDEVEQAGVRPLHVLERQHGGIGVGQPLEEQPPGREEVLAVAGRALLQAEQVGEPGLDEASLFRVEQMLVQRRCELGARRGGSSSSPMRQRIRTMSASAQ